jgi:hypothetical protein
MILAVLAMLLAAVPAAAETKGKCIYWFGFCTSCEKPFTCKNSRRSDKPAAETQRSVAKPASRKPTKTRSATPRQRLTPPQQARRKPPLRRDVRTAQNSNLDREFREFKQFIRLKQLNGEYPNNPKVAELFLRYKLWSIERRK